MDSIRDGKRPLWRGVVVFANRLQVTYYLIRLGEILTAILPLRVSYALAIAIADSAYLVGRMLRRQVAANVGQVLGEKAESNRVTAVTRAVFRNYLKYLIDFVRVPALGRPELERILDVAGFEHLDRALQAGKGVLFVGLHFGSFEFGWAILAARGYRVSIAVDTFQPPKLDALVQRRRAAKGVNLIPVEAATAGVRLVRSLRRNDVLALLIDRPLPDEGVPVQFCGAITRVPGGLATLALKTGARIVPAYLTRRPDNTFRGTILPHIEPENSEDWQHDVQRLTQRVMQALEASVKQYPEQWYMFREMWPRELIQNRVALVAEA